MERKLAAILAADVVGYSRLMEQDEAKTFQRVKAHRNELIEPAITEHRGCIFKLMGDGLLAEFASVVDAVECGVDIQRGMAERNAGEPQDQRTDIRIGINLGEVIVEGADRHGDGVNIAARLQQLADPGGICVSGKVAKEVETKLAFGFVPMGEQKVKNISEPIPVYRVKVDGAPLRRRRASHKSRLPVWARPIAAAMGLAGLAAAGWYGLMRSPSHLASAHAPSIAVLPFDDLSPDKTLGYLGDGMSEDIITMLSRFPDLSVIAHNSSFTYKGKPVDIRQVGRDLNVDYALEGSVRKRGKDTADLGEYDYYLRGHDIYMNAKTKEENDRAARIWEEGLARYPDSSLIKVKLGFYHWTNGFNWWADDISAELRKANAIGREVLAKDNLTPQVKRLAHWLLALALPFEREFSRSQGEADAAIAMAPYDAFAIGKLAIVPIMAGKPQKGLEQADFALAHDPNALKDLQYTRGWALRLIGKYEYSLAAFKQADMVGDTPLNIAINLIRLGRMNEAQAQVKLMLEKNDPKFTQAKWRQGYFYSDPSIVDGEVADLAKAGLPEK